MNSLFDDKTLQILVNVAIPLETLHNNEMDNKTLCHELKEDIKRAVFLIREALGRNKLTNESRQRHIETRGMECCPFCQVEWDYVDFDREEHTEDGDICQKAKCTNCNKRWKDVYRLTEIHEIR